MDRILQNTTATLRVTVATDGTPTNPSPDSATVTVTRADGTIVKGPVAATDDGTGIFATNLDPDDTALLDTLTLTWTFTMSGDTQTLVTHAEVVGGFLFSIAEFRALSSAYANTTNYPTATILAMRTTVEQALEDACNVAFVPRYAQETLNGDGGTTVMLRWPYIRSVRSFTIDDVAGTTADVAFQPSGVAYLQSGWTAGYSNIIVGYEHGHGFPPARIKRAALILAKSWITPSSVDDRAINVTNETGTYALFQAGVRGHQFSIPEVQAAVDAYSLAVGVA